MSLFLEDSQLIWQLLNKPGSCLFPKASDESRVKSRSRLINGQMLTWNNATDCRDHWWVLPEYFPDNLGKEVTHILMKPSDCALAVLWMSCDKKRKASNWESICFLEFLKNSLNTRKIKFNCGKWQQFYLKENNIQDLRICFFEGQICRAVMWRAEKWLDCLCSQHQTGGNC